MSEQLPEILPCPFCRCPATLKEFTTTADPWWFVECSFCYAKSSQWRPAVFAVAQWNRRGCAGDRQPITEEWLREVGFRWSQFDRQNEKHWILWLGGALVDHHAPAQWQTSDSEDLGIEFASGHSQEDLTVWFCWLRSDTSHRYHRFLHVRHIAYRDELIALVEALTGRSWNPANHLYGGVCTPERAERLKREHDRLDKVIHREQHVWMEHEKDGDRCRPLPEHIDAARKGGLAK